MSPRPPSPDNPKSQPSFSPFVHTAESLEYITTHVFLPFQPPDADDYTPEKNHSLVRAVCTAAHAYGTHVCGTSEQDQWNRISKMLDNLQAYVRSEDMNKDNAMSQLKGMQTGDILVFFIRRQNAAIILTKREKYTLWEAFEVLPNEDVVKEVKDPLRCSYPGSATEVRNEVFDNWEFRLQFANFFSHPNIDSDLPLPPPSHPRYVDILLNNISQGTLRATDIAPVTKRRVVSKRIRDHVGRWWIIGDKDAWRRSALWLLTRVAIQISVHGSSEFASYKRFNLFFMCTLASNANNASLSTNMLPLMLSRIPGRLKKLGSFSPDWLTEVALKSCACLREILDARWKELSVRRSPFWNPSPEELARDTQLSLLNSREYIKRALRNSGHEPVGPFRPGHRSRGTIDNFLSSNGTFFDEAYEADPHATLYDVERSVGLGIDDWVACVTDVDAACAQLGFLLDKYLMGAYKHFKENPEEISLVLLTAIELYVALDKLAVREIPMLADYPPGISIAFLEKMLLRKETSLHRLSCAYQYLSARHSQSRPGWSVISDDFTEDSFPVRFYDQSLQLQQVKAQIEEDAMIRITGHVDPRPWHCRLTPTTPDGKQANPGQAQQRPAESTEISQSLLPPSLLHAKVVVFELQCPACVQIWRAAAPCILNSSFLLTDAPMLESEEGLHLLKNFCALQPFFVTKDHRPSLHVQIHLAYTYPQDSCNPTLLYVAQHHYWKEESYIRLSVPGQIRQAGRSCSDWELSFNLGPTRFGNGPELLKKYINSISHTCNHVVATQAECPPALSADDFSALTHLRSGGSLQWLNILHGLRCRTLNFRCDEVHFLLAHAACQVGPLDPNMGTWDWHQELQDSSFCNALLDELESLFGDAGAGSIDWVLMITISLLITRVLASSPCESISDRGITLLRSICRKLFNWAQELSYDLSKAPTNSERRHVLLYMAYACRSTFDINAAALHALFHSAADVDALLSCAFFIAALPKFMFSPPDDQTILYQRDHRLSYALEETLKDAILADPLDHGIDLAIGRIFVSHSPGIWRWEQLTYPNAHWLTCQTKVTDQTFQTVHVNLLTGALHVDGKSLSGSLQEIWKFPEFENIFHDQGFLVNTSSLSGMDFTTLEHKVHFSLQSDQLVIRMQDEQTNETLELVPSRMLQKDLPPSLIRDHVHWLNLSTKIIEIRPLKQHLEQSTEHWRIDCTLGQYYMCQQGAETLVEIQSPTWIMVMKCFECLNKVDESELEYYMHALGLVGELWSLSEDLLITASLAQSTSASLLSVTLPRYGLSFFINERRELESRDFKHMVYDKDQSIGTLFGLENFLILRQNPCIAGNLVPEALIHRQVLIPNGYPRLHVDSNQVRIDIMHRVHWGNGADKPLYHTYDVDTELGCLRGDGSFGSTIFLASLHAMTNCHQPDPLTGKTGIQAALCLFRSGGCRSIMKQKVDAEFFRKIRIKDPQVNSALKDIQTRYYWDRDMYRLSNVSYQDKQVANMFALNATPSQPSSPKGQHCGEILHSMHDPDPALLVFPSATSTLQYIFNSGSPVMTLDHLICNRPAPELPDRITLHLDGILTPADNSDTTALDQLFSSLSADSSFKREYLARLDASARHTHMVSQAIRVHKTAGADLVRVEDLKEYYVQCRANYLQSLDILKRSLSSTDLHEQALHQSGQWPRITADGLLRYLASTSPVEVPRCWKKCLTSLSLVLLDLQRARRLLRFVLEGREEEFSKELENKGYDGWDPEEYPDWLLIQIQGNFLIRRAQAEIAMEIMSPRSNGNAVMQVNMGDGKSSVIIPIAAAALANGKQLVRVIVPKALTAQMFDILVALLGGLTNRPVYHLPFSRTPENDHEGRINSLQIDDLHKFMSQCMVEGGILLAQPEHVVSLKLMGVEEQTRASGLTTEPSMKSQKSIYTHLSGTLLLRSKGGRADSSFRLSTQLSNHSGKENDTLADDRRTREVHDAVESRFKWLNLQNWLYNHARDILDESDEILHPRFQLVYTMGPQQHVDGYPDRWTITQQVLRLVKKHLYSLSRYAPDAIEYRCEQPGSFPHLRIVRATDIDQRLMSFIVNDVMAGKLPNINFQYVPPAIHDGIQSFISDKNVLQIPAIAKMVEEYAKDSDQSHLWSGLLLLRGLLTSNILWFALTERRWRVDYGLAPEWQRANHNHPHTTLAVPYRAKDVPALNTQFGHPDLTIILTCLSYYYAGLSEKELRYSFEVLLDLDNPSEEYACWIEECTASLPDSLRNLKNINLRSSEQWDNVVSPLFSTNQAAIDFYLSRVVFPKEATEFPWKLSGSSWDLVEKRGKLITGFSGTNDGQWLLPMSIAQQELDHQKGTNARVLAHLLRPENGSYRVIHNVDERQQSTETYTLLRRIAEQQPEIRVLLDVGSQILDLSNDKVAFAWLEVSPDSAGAIYFNDRDELMVLTRNGKRIPMPSSSLSQQLERCVVYLDHAHTMGIDIRLPIGSRAAVMLGPKVTKDALVQGCMRMRKLGRGHSVMFFAPPEVDRIIRAVAGKTDPHTQVTTVDILSWTIRETWTDIEQRAPYWAQQGMSHRSRYAAWSQFADGKLTQEKLTDAWLQAERKSLTDLYEPRETKGPSSSLLALDHDIRQRCKALGVLSIPKAEMEEEQEREVSREKERERELELPPMAEPAEHFLHPDVRSFVRTGVIPLHSRKVFQPVFAILGKSSAATRDADVWSPHVLATTDFRRTIKPESTQGTTDQYLRPVQWILKSKIEREPVLVLLSPFEVNCLLPDIRESEAVHLHMYAPRTAQRMKPSDDLRLYSIPPLPSNWAPPWELIDQLNVFAGQLYLRDYESYTRLCRFLDVNDTTVRRNLFNIPGSFEDMAISFSGSPLHSVRALLGIRSRGRPFAHTHMGKILQGQLLTKKDFQGTSLDASDRCPAVSDAQTSQNAALPRVGDDNGSSKRPSIRAEQQ